MEALVGERELPTVGLISLCVQRINRTQTGVSKMRFVHLRHALFMRLKFVLSSFGDQLRGAKHTKEKFM
jgi:hypothetical protein